MPFSWWSFSMGNVVASYPFKMRMISVSWSWQYVYQEFRLSPRMMDRTLNESWPLPTWCLFSSKNPESEGKWTWETDRGKEILFGRASLWNKRVTAGRIFTSPHGAHVACCLARLRSTWDALPSKHAPPVHAGALHCCQPPSLRVFIVHTGPSITEKRSSSKAVPVAQSN